MGRYLHISARNGFSLVETLVVMGILALFLAVGAATLNMGLRQQETRGAAQSWQAAAGWAQVGVLYQGGSTQVSYDQGALVLSHDFGLCGGSLGNMAPAVDVEPNVGRWDEGRGAEVSFSGALASPDGGGTLMFLRAGVGHRVVIRPVSGLTQRVADLP